MEEEIKSLKVIDLFINLKLQSLFFRESKVVKERYDKRKRTKTNETIKVKEILDKFK